MLSNSFNDYLTVKHCYYVDIAIFRQYHIGIVSKLELRYWLITRADKIEYSLLWIVDLLLGFVDLFRKVIMTERYSFSLTTFRFYILFCCRHSDCWPSCYFRVF